MKGELNLLGVHLLSVRTSSVLVENEMTDLHLLSVGTSSVLIHMIGVHFLSEQARKSCHANHAMTADQHQAPPGLFILLQNHCFQ